MEVAIPREHFVSLIMRTEGWFSKNLRSWPTTTQHQACHRECYPFKGFCLLVLLYSLKFIKHLLCALGAQTVKNLPAMQETQVRSLGQEDPLEEGMSTHTSTLAWRIPWTEEIGRLQSMGLRRVRHD